MDVEEFVKVSVDIEYKEEAEAYGYHPFHMFVETHNGEINLIVIADASGVEQCYKIFSEYIFRKARRIYMALDFPAMGDIQNDFVCVFEYEFIDYKASFRLFAIPYNTADGTCYERINDCGTFKYILTDFQNIARKLYKQ